VGTVLNNELLSYKEDVSIQLISPASGDSVKGASQGIASSFHSINIPSEWGLSILLKILTLFKMEESFHSINIPSEWGQYTPITNGYFICFHSINIPSEWGRYGVTTLVWFKKDVSIQLISPASGD
jgi:hypothetical protein